MKKDAEIVNCDLSVSLIVRLSEILHKIPFFLISTFFQVTIFFPSICRFLLAVPSNFMQLYWSINLSQQFSSALSLSAKFHYFSFDDGASNVTKTSMQYLVNLYCSKHSFFFTYKHRANFKRSLINFIF